MSHGIVRHTARALTAAVITGSALLATTDPALAAEPAGLPMAPLASKINQAGINQVLAKHNSARDEVGVAHLSWDAGLAGDAQAYVDKFAAANAPSIDHDQAELDRLNENENLAASFGTDPIKFGLDFWYGEKSAFDADPNKNARKGVAWGHYSQMVWSSTTRIGCGMAHSSGGSAQGMDFVSCRFSPPGNRFGQPPFTKGGGPTPGTGGGTTPGTGGGTTPAGDGPNPAACAYNPQGRGGYGSYVDGLALDQRDWEQDLANAINAYRAQHGVPAVRYSRTLARPAMWSSLDGYNTKGFKPNGLDSRGMDTAARVRYCSGYTGYLGEVRYWNTAVAGAKWQRALAFWQADPGANRWLLDRRVTTFAVGMAYGGDDVNRAPAYYTVTFGDH